MSLWMSAEIYRNEYIATINKVKQVKHFFAESYGDKTLECDVCLKGICTCIMGMIKII